MFAHADPVAASLCRCTSQRQCRRWTAPPPKTRYRCPAACITIALAVCKDSSPCSPCTLPGRAVGMDYICASVICFAPHAHESKSCTTRLPCQTSACFDSLALVEYSPFGRHRAEPALPWRHCLTSCLHACWPSLDSHNTLAAEWQINGRSQGLTSVAGARMAVAATALTRTTAAQVQARQAQQQPPALRRPGPQVGLQMCSRSITVACFMPCP
jgi:hypothetical protein